jgi:O-methyltransferase
MMKQFLERAVRRLLRGRSALAVTLSSTAQMARDARLTYLNEGKLAALERALADVVRSAVPGAFIECGIALGGSALIIVNWMPAGREFHGYDVFGMIPPPTSEHDDDKSRARYEVIKSGRSAGIGGDPYYGYAENLYEQVVDNFARFGHPVDGSHITLHKGLFEETLRPPPQIAFAHIDCDWYDPVTVCLQRIVPNLSRGGYVILDDYNDYGGCRRATDEFVKGRHNIQVIASEPSLVLRLQ